MRSSCLPKSQPQPTREPVMFQNISPDASTKPPLTSLSWLSKRREWSPPVVLRILPEFLDDAESADSIDFTLKRKNRTKTGTIRRVGGGVDAINPSLWMMLSYTFQCMHFLCRHARDPNWGWYSPLSGSRWVTLLFSAFECFTLY